MTHAFAGAIVHFRELPELRTQRLLLRPFRPGDLEAVFAYASDPEVARYTIFDYHRSLDDTRRFLDPVLEHQARGNGLPLWGVCENGRDHVIGSIGFTVMAPMHARGEIGYALARPYWGRGYMTEAVQAVIRFGFDRMHLNRVEATCDANHAASARVMEKAGMRFEGVLRQYIVLKGTSRDARIYAIVRSDWAGEQ